MQKLPVVAMHYFHLVMVLVLIASLVADIGQLDDDFFFHAAMLGNLTVMPSNGCVLTFLENKLRLKADLPPIKGWIKHYFINFKENRKDWGI